MRLRDLGEDALILRLRERLAAGASPAEVVVGPGDDAAAFESPSGRLTLFTCDALVEEVHFRRRWMPPRSLGWKALAVNVSDLAAMGGRPTFGLVTLSLPGDLEVEFVDALYDGLIACGEAYGCRIVGGDVVGSPGPVSVSVALIGEVEPEHLLRRSGAQVGDGIFVTGELGGAAAGLALLEAGAKGEEAADAIKRHLEPRPRLEEARLLASSGLVTAMMDLSDGIADDLPRLCLESKVGAEVSVQQLPRHPAVEAVAASTGKPASELALTGGEDYELLFTAPAEKAAELADELKGKTGTRVSMIGSIVAREQGVRFLDEGGRAIPCAEGYRHFGG